MMPLLLCCSCWWPALLTEMRSVTEKSAALAAIHSNM